MGRLSKNLSGLHQKVIVGTASYTDDTTFAAFIANAPEGEVGVFTEAGAVETGAILAGEKFFIAQKRDGAINKTPMLAFNDLYRKLRTAYDAPVKQVSTIGYNGTSGDIGFNFTTATSTNTLTYGITARETTPGNQPFPVQEGYATVNSTTADEYTVLAAIVSQLNNDFDYQKTAPDPFVKAEILTNGALTEFVEDPTVTYGSKTVTFAGNVTIATGAHVKFEGVAGPTYRAAVGVTAGTTITLDRPYQGATKTEDVSVTVNIAGTAAFTSGTTALGVQLTSLQNETHFKVVGAGLLYQDTVTAITAWKLGSGAGTQIYELESTEGIINDGIGSTRNVAFKEDYGQPTLFASKTGTYDQIFLDFKPSITPSAALPIYEQKQIQRVLIAAPVGGSLNSNLVTIFGL